MVVETRPAAEITLWTRRARWLAGATIAWNIVEGLLALGFGWEEGSVALFGFGVDSWVEVGSAGVVYWKLTHDTTCATTQLRTERRAIRVISTLFLVLATATSLGAVAQLVSSGHPASTVPALAVSGLSLSLMFFLWAAKSRVATELDSATLAMDAACSRACIELSAVLFVGSLVYVLWPVLWWADAVAALGLALLIGREGVEGLRSASREDFAGGCGCR